MTDTEREAAQQRKTQVLLLATRQACLMILGAIEDYLQMPRSVPPKHGRNL